MDLRHGVCRNLIEENVPFSVPPASGPHGKDLRAGHCEIDYLCKTAKEFENWDEDKKKKFIRFVEEKKLDHVDYSVLMDNDSLLEEFDSRE